MLIKGYNEYIGRNQFGVVFKAVLENFKLLYSKSKRISRSIQKLSRSIRRRKINLAGRVVGESGANAIKSI